MSEVKDAVGEGKSTLDIQDAIQENDLINFIKALNLKKTGDSNTTNLLSLTQSGQGFYNQWPQRLSV